MADILVTKKVLLRGVVQGVGFRPFVYRLASFYQLKGVVRNFSGGVEIIVNGYKAEIEGFLRDLKEQAPPNSRLEAIEIENLTTDLIFTDFKIGASKNDENLVEKNLRIPIDLGLCAQCLQELLDSTNRRYFYPYINCTNCGPRFSIIERLPYDRVNTVMNKYKMCELCEAEYNNPLDRRFHAQPIACHECGPRLFLYDSKANILQEGGNAQKTYSLFKTLAQLLEKGAIIALKGLGGYHLACDAFADKVVNKLRRLKNREEKPFALMFADLNQLSLYTEISSWALARLKQVDFPIMLLPKRLGSPIAESVALKSRELGVMLPYTPVQHLLFCFFNRPLVMTSANLSDEPIIYNDQEALTKLPGKICDYLLLGERPILLPIDDSVIREFRKNDYPLRRARGMSPAPLILETKITKPILALGAELKNTICLAYGESAFLSQHLGDLKKRMVYQSFLNMIEHFCKVFKLKPQIIAHDLHPLYLSTQFTSDPPAGWEWVLETLKFPVQHHHAHLVSCLAENGLKGPALGLSLDGTGLGSDGNLWGCEIMFFTAKSFERLASLKPVVMPGGELAINQPWRMSLVWLKEAFGPNFLSQLPPSLQNISDQKILVTKIQLENATGLPRTTSCGRLFDAFSALCGVCFEQNYDGQAAIEFEQIQDKTCLKPLDFDFSEQQGFYTIYPEEAFRQAVAALKRGNEAKEVATAFHKGLVEVLAKITVSLGQKIGVREVVLSGGCFMNKTLLTGLIERFEKEGFKPIWHLRVPCNDGGVSLGQAIVAQENLE